MKAKQQSFTFLDVRKKKRARRGKLLSHDPRQAFVPGTAVHVTLRCAAKVPNLRCRRRFACVARAFRKVGAEMGESVRLIHFAVLGNHVHLVMEAESSAALSKAVQKMCLSMSRSLNAESVRRSGGDLDPRHGAWSERKGWLGRVFADRHHRELLTSPRQIQNAITYLFRNAENHYKQIEGVRCSIDLRGARLYFFNREKTADLFPDIGERKRVWADAYTSLGYMFGEKHFARGAPLLVSRPRNALVARETMSVLRKL